MNRREFLQKSAGAAVAIVAAPTAVVTLTRQQAQTLNFSAAYGGESWRLQMLQIIKERRANPHTLHKWKFPVMMQETFHTET